MRRCTWARTAVLHNPNLFSANFYLVSQKLALDFSFLDSTHQRPRKVCYRESLCGVQICRDCSPRIIDLFWPVWNVSSTCPPFEQESVKLTLTPASRPFLLGFDHGSAPLGARPILVKPIPDESEAFLGFVFRNSQGISTTLKICGSKRYQSWRGQRSRMNFEDYDELRLTHSTLLPYGK